MPRTILLVHTNEALGRFLTVLLQQDGHGIIPAGSVKEALCVVQTKAPHVVIIEDGCPEISTLDLVQRLQRGAEEERLPVIVISADPAMEYEYHNVFDFLLKPVDVNRLRQDLAFLSRGGRKRVPPARLGHLTDEESRLYCDYLLTNSGLHFERRNQKLLERGITSRMSAIHSASYRDYYDYLSEYGENRQELQKLLQHLTVGETFFFRYRAHFDALRQLVSNGELAGKPLRIWSAGCSTGEEPYSLAMTIMEALPDWRKRDIRILATDINNRSLQRAREGVYRPWSLRATEPRCLERYFNRVGDSYLIRDEVKQLVEFSHLNLQTAAFPQSDGPFRELDVIFCRNVTIYFTLATTRRIIDKFAATLTPTGYLFLGHAEALTHISTKFERVSRESGFYYRKKSPSAVTAAPLTRPRPVKKAVLPDRPPAVPPPPKVLVPRPKVVPVSVPTPEELYRQARELFDAEDFSGAEALLADVLRQEPDHLDALVMKGFVCANRGQFQEALALCGEVVARDDLHSDAYFLRGLVLEIEEQLPDALAEYRKALLLDMDFVMPHYCMGRIYFRTGRERDGMREFRNCLRLLEHSPEGDVVPYGGGLSREVFMERVRTELARVA